jgi:flagellar secretion chaperone FliS
MDQRHVASAYREASFENAPPIKIVRLLYVGALRFIDQAANEDARDPRSKFAYNVTRADSIVAELRLSLRKDLAPDVADNLEQLYLFVEERLHDAMRAQDKRPLEDARRVLANLQDAWKQVEVG